MYFKYKSTQYKRDANQWYTFLTRQIHIQQSIIIIFTSFKFFTDGNFSIQSIETIQNNTTQQHANAQPCIVIAGVRYVLKSLPDGEPPIRSLVVDPHISKKLNILKCSQ